MADFTRLPQPLPPQPADTMLADLACRVTGGIAPMLCVELDAGQLVLFNPAALLWKEPSIGLARGDDDVVQAEGPGRCGFSLGFAGAVFPMPLARGESVHVRDGHFLLSIGVEMVRDQFQDLGSRLSGSEGLAICCFTGGPGGGVVWMQARGDMFERGLMEGENFDIQRDAWLCKDEAVNVQAIFIDIDSGAHSEPACLRFTGRGRVAFQTVPAPPALMPGTVASGSAGRLPGGFRAAATSLLERIQG